MSLPAGLLDAMITEASTLREPSVVLPREDALRVIEEQERLGGCGPLCRSLLSTPSEWGVEEAYAITSRGLVRVAEGALEIPGREALVASGLAGFLGVYHTHPGGLVVPTPHDLAGAAARGSRVECVGGKSWGVARVMCLEAQDPAKWLALASAWRSLEPYIAEADYFAPYPLGSWVVLVPAPSPRAALRIEHAALALAEENGFTAYIAEAGAGY